MSVEAAENEKYSKHAVLIQTMKNRLGRKLTFVGLASNEHSSGTQALAKIEMTTEFRVWCQSYRHGLFLFSGCNGWEESKMRDVRCWDVSYLVPTLIQT